LKAHQINNYRPESQQHQQNGENLRNQQDGKNRLKTNQPQVQQQQQQQKQLKQQLHHQDNENHKPELHRIKNQLKRHRPENHRLENQQQHGNFENDKQENSFPKKSANIKENFFHNKNANCQLQIKSEVDQRIAEEEGNKILEEIQKIISCGMTERNPISQIKSTGGLGFRQEARPESESYQPAKSENDYSKVRASWQNSDPEKAKNKLKDSHQIRSGIADQTKFDESSSFRAPKCQQTISKKFYPENKLILNNNEIPPKRSKTEKTIELKENLTVKAASTAKDFLPVKTVQTAPTIQIAPTVKAVQTIKVVTMAPTVKFEKTVMALQTLQAIKTAPTVRDVKTFQTIQTVKTAPTVTVFQTVQTLDYSDLKSIQEEPTKIKPPLFVDVNSNQLIQSNNASDSAKRQDSKVKVTLNGFRCFDCNFHSTSKALLRNHRDEEQHFSKTTETCKICNKHFASSSTYKFHLTTVHRNREKFECQHCGKKFGRKDNFECHVVAVHLKVKRFGCQSCNQKFGTESSMKEHAARTHGIAAWKCDTCSLVFKQKFTFKSHMLKVHGKQVSSENVCLLCNEFFQNKTDLTDHKTNIHGQKSWKCEQCGKVFGRKDYLNNHVNGFHQKMKFNCQQCEKVFSYHAGLFTHIQKFHK
jgi:KRAB domain-containing zinc finger protein